MEIVVICYGYYSGLNLNNRMGIARDERGNKFAIDFFTHFSDRMRKINPSFKSDNGLWIDKQNCFIVDKDYYEELKYGQIKLIFSEEAKKVLPFYNIMFQQEFSWVDVGEKDDEITYLTLKRRAERLSGDDEWNNRFRETMKVGKFYRKVLPFFDEKNIEKIVNICRYNYKDQIEHLITNKLVSGEEIRKWYLGKNYVYGEGPLNNSCMRYAQFQKRMKVYTENPDVVNLLILLDPDGKLLGRALIWKLSVPEGKYYMDRIYVNHDKYKQFFVNYAKEKNMITFESPNDRGVGENPRKMIVELKRNYGSCSKNPYMDTFKFFHVSDMTLRNYVDLSVEPFSKGGRIYYDWECH